MSEGSDRERLLQFLQTIRRPEKAMAAISDEENLVRSGLIDSLAVLEIIMFLETEFGIDFSKTGVDPSQLMTIPSILGLIERYRA
jgi:methoxymalonate biosynthesis acyl carrier protein